MVSELNNIPMLEMPIAYLVNERVFERRIINKVFSGYFVRNDINGSCNFKRSFSFATTLIFIV